MSPRVLILSAAVGGGHLRAAEAVATALRQTVPSATVKDLDVLELTNAAFRRIYGRAYFDLANRAPHVLGYFYDLLDQPGRPGRASSGDRMRLAIERLNLRQFIRFLQSEPWDLIINTHFLPAEIVAWLRKRGRLRVPQVTVTTDFETHRLWINQPCEHYFTATEEGARYLHHLGVPAGDVSITGIPIHPNFCEEKAVDACLARHGLAGDRPVILQMAGGFGVGPIEQLYRALLEVEFPLDLVVVAGRNEKARARLRAAPVPARHRVHILGYTSDIDELLVAADLVVTKPGGLTTSETLARGTAMVIVSPIPGQEARNSDYLLENGAAIKVNHIPTLPFKVRELLADPPRLAQIKANARRLGRPRAAFDVVERSLQFIRPARKGGVGR
jgi:processive 1,2-diacylglycerol beta-glucosyltransferase